MVTNSSSSSPTASPRNIRKKKGRLWQWSKVTMIWILLVAALGVFACSLHLSMTSSTGPAFSADQLLLPILEVSNEGSSNHPIMISRFPNRIHGLDRICNMPPGDGLEGKMGYQGLIRIERQRAAHGSEDEASTPKSVTTTTINVTSEVSRSVTVTTTVVTTTTSTFHDTPNGTTAVRVLCAVLTNSEHHTTRIQAILETYGQRCDGFVALSNVADPSLGAVVLFGSDSDKHRDGTTPSSPRWQQMRSAWGYIYEHYRADYECFHLGGDDMYLIVENLRWLCASKSTEAENTFDAGVLYMGAPIVPGASKNDKTKQQHYYCGGSAGITVNRAGLRLLVDEVYQSDCIQRAATEVVADDDDTIMELEVVQCLRNHVSEKGDSRGNVCPDTDDEEESSRYHLFDLTFRTSHRPGLDKDRKEIYQFLKPRFEIKRSFLVDSISPTTVSFSLDNKIVLDETREKKVEDAIRRYDAIVYRKCDGLWEKHLGALDESGQPGYVHDVKYLRSNPPPFSPDRGANCQVEFGEGVEGKEGYKGLLKIHTDETSTKKTTSSWQPRLLCLVYTHSNRHEYLRAIAETYAPRCDGFFAASNETDRSIGAVNLLHEFPETYENMWMKVRNMWVYAYDNYLDDFDIFMIGGDDLYVVPENLRNMYATATTTGANVIGGVWNHSDIQYFGGSIKLGRFRFCSGGSGYVLNQAGLKLLVEELFETQACWPHHMASDEDRIIARCFRKIGGLNCSNTNDERNESRFHEMDVQYHASWTRQTPTPWHWESLEKFHDIVSLERLGQISESTVSFHVKQKRGKSTPDLGAPPPETIRRYHAILYRLCNKTK